jgi:hypothetical protein
MPYYSPILPSVFVNEAPRALIAKTKSNQSQGREATLLKVLYSCLMSMGGSVLEAKRKPPLLNHATSFAN